MAAAVSVEEYLHSSFDCWETHYVDGVVVQRGLATIDLGSVPFDMEELFGKLQDERNRGR